jgi:virginiamycin A acetyltransferase
MTTFPDPQTRHPVKLAAMRDHTGTVFLAPATKDHPRFEVGDYTYASAIVPPKDWAVHLAPYLFDFSPERLVIGKFCQIADGVMFVTSSANHRYDGFSSYPFGIFDGGLMHTPAMPDPGPDTIIGHDVWLGQGAKVLPGARIGSGVIVGAGAVVGGRIPDFAIVAGNPARVIRMRFDSETVAALMDIAWWHWPIAHIRRHEDAIVGADIDKLRAAAP